ncbi:zeaxanthin epoxidase, chloroplastic [Elaeis guineensis]|uniref:Zeaxanthin epoxidase, chloroplastic n=1 Tax=Elaeis guineensis var. tenera TaxID=51953 RepID=A0A6I9RGJ1_ELAGV|nr:zeaxanthin epoxidase, chloroplastic [Elaeis guineensis]
MKALAASSSLSLSNPRWPLSSPSPHFPLQTLISASLPFPSISFQGSSSKQLPHLTTKKESSWSPLRSSPTEDPLPDPSERWLLEPIGDGDTRHIGFRVPLPGAFEIASDVVTVGRTPEKADIVIPVATVSSVHARLKKRDGSLLVMDLDSTNGTYVNDQKLKPGAVAAAFPGSSITFGDTHLAMFRVSKIEEAELTSKTGESENRPEADVSTDNVEATSGE